MTETEIRAIVADIDGTLTDSSRRIQWEGVDALRRVQQSGFTVMLASGNVLPVALGLHTFIGLKGPIIAENGGIVSYMESVHRLNSISQPFRAYKHLKAREDRAQRLFTDRWRETEVALKRIIDPEVVRENLKDFRVVVEATGFAIHIMEPGHSKMNGIVKACQLLDIGVDQVAAFGDSDNDVSMISGCGKGIAVANASRSVKEVADYVTSRPHAAGVAEGLKWLGLL